MGRYETSVGPTLQILAEGGTASLEKEEKQRLTEYLTYKLMVLDWFDDQPVLPPNLAREFCRSRAIPAELDIWLLDCVGPEWQCAFYTQAVGLGHGHDGPLAPNTKSFTVGIGNLLVFALFSSKAKIDIHFNEASSFRLWPDHGRELVWPFQRLTSDADADFVASVFDRMPNKPQRHRP